jgi:hypothetical protein
MGTVTSSHKYNEKSEGKYMYQLLLKGALSHLTTVRNSAKHTFIAVYETLNMVHRG